MTHNLYYPLGWFYHFLHQTFFSASEMARWPQTLGREIIFTNEMRQKCFIFWKDGNFHVQQFLAKGSFVFPMALRVTGPCLFGDCLLRTDSRANLPRKYVWASGRWGAMAGGDKYRVSRIRELITIMKYYCHVSFWWSRHDGRWSDKHQNVCNANIGVTS